MNTPFLRKSQNLMVQKNTAPDGNSATPVLDHLTRDELIHHIEDQQEVLRMNRAFCTCRYVATISIQTEDALCGIAELL
jgi:hypothetical protein